jgi:uncharacterized protein YrrD
MVGTPVMSLQTGRRLGVIGQPIINPHDLHIVAFYVDGPRLDYNPSILFSSDIRELGNFGAIVDSSDNIMSSEGLVRLKTVLDYHFMLDGLKVIDDHKRKLGLIEGYVFDSDSFMVQQIFVKPTIGKRMSITHLTINRKQIIKIDNQQITVKAPDDKISSVAQKVANPNQVPFENPFRTVPVEVSRFRQP